MGHGQSVNGDGIRGYFHGGWFTAVEDTMQLMEDTKAAYPDLPYILFGLAAMVCIVVFLIIPSMPDKDVPDISGKYYAEMSVEDYGIIRMELDAGKIVVVSGFQGVDSDGDITTLGRGGSDTTAVALAAYLHADCCQIFTDVDGVYDRDPRIFGDAVRFARISYEKMMALIENGAQVLHDRSVELAREHGIRVEVLSAFTGAPGTVVGDLE